MLIILVQPQYDLKNYSNALRKHRDSVPGRLFNMAALDSAVNVDTLDIHHKEVTSVADVYRNTQKKNLQY